MARHYQLIEERSNRWFAKAEVSKLKPDEQVLLNKSLAKFRNYGESKIIDHVYAKHPYFSIYSKRKMTPKQEKQARQEREKVNRQSKQLLFTIGYEGESIDAYLNKLVKNNIRLLCDVRKNPLSMKYGFSKKWLISFCKSLGIAYQHFPELGIASDKRRKLQSTRNYRMLFGQYKQTLPTMEQSLSEVKALLREHRRIALTCFEKEPAECHRHCISDYLRQQENIACQHL